MSEREKFGYGVTCKDCGQVFTAPASSIKRHPNGMCPPPRPAAQRTCGETNARHCPVHQEPAASEPKEWWIKEYVGVFPTYDVVDAAVGGFTENDFSAGLAKKYHVIEHSAYMEVVRERDELALRCANQEKVIDDERATFARNMKTAKANALASYEENQQLRAELKIAKNGELKWSALCAGFLEGLEGMKDKS